jgi:hypothetical protein
MKQHLTTFILALTYLCAHAQAPNWSWAQRAGTTGYDWGFKTTTDVLGNIYVIGSYDSPSITFGTNTLTNGGMYIVKYDASGNVLWAKDAGGAGNSSGIGIITDALGNIYITGSFSTLITFGTTTLSSEGLRDIFIVKYDALGNILWAKSAGNTNYDDGNSITTDGLGNVYVTGTFWSPTITFGATTLTNAGSSPDIFVVKYDASGNVIWAKSAGGSPMDYAISITSDYSNNVYVSGHYYSPSITFGATTLINAGYGDIFIAKYDTSGNVLWAKGAGGAGNDESYSIITSPSGYFYVIGNFNSPSLTFGPTILTHLGNTDDIFVVKYDAFGNAIWAKSIGGTGNEKGNCITVDSNENVYIIGNYNSSSLNLGADTLINQGSYDFFIEKLDSSGNILWSKGTGSVGDDEGLGVVASLAGEVYVTGYYSDLISFEATTLTNAGILDMFFSKLDIANVAIEEENQPNEIKIFPNPSNGIFTFNEIIKSIEVFNMMGELVLSQGNAKQINLQGFPKGIYVARVNGIQVCRLVKE